MNRMSPDSRQTIPRPVRHSIDMKKRLIRELRAGRSVRAATILLVGLLLLRGPAVDGASAATLPLLDAGLVPIPCPKSPVSYASGRYILAGKTCSLKGSITISSSALLVVSGSVLTVDGDINVSGSGVFAVFASTLSMANHILGEHTISATDDALVNFEDSWLVTNAGDVGTSISGLYAGRGRSTLRVVKTRLDPAVSWLLAQFSENARLETVDSPEIPTETYPAEAATISIAGPLSGNNVWLRFFPGQSGTLDGSTINAPPGSSFRFGRSTPGKTNVGFDVNVSKGQASLSIESHPGSAVSISNAYTGIAYNFDGNASSAEVSGLGIGDVTHTYTDLGRTLALRNVHVNMWQLYGSSMRAPVTVLDSKINEMGAFDDGRFIVTRSTFLFAVISAQGTGANISVSGSSIKSQMIQARDGGFVGIADSDIYGSLIQAAGGSRIALVNAALRANAPPTQNPTTVHEYFAGGNPFTPTGASVRLMAMDTSAILVAGLDPIKEAVTSGQILSLTGDALLDSPVKALKAFTYALSYRRVDQTAYTVIVASAAGPRTRALGSLDTSGLAAGQYQARLELVLPDGFRLPAERLFSIAASTVLTKPAFTGFAAVSSSSLVMRWASGGNPPGTTFLVQLSTNSFSTVAASSRTLNLAATFSGLTPDTAYAGRVRAQNSVAKPTAFTAPASTTTRGLNGVEPAMTGTVYPGAGGTVGDARKRIVVPRGAVAETLTLKVWPEDTLDAAREALKRADEALRGLIRAGDSTEIVALLPDGTSRDRFLMPVQVTLAFDPFVAAPHLTLGVFYWDESRLRWQAIAGTTVDRDARSVTASVDHLTTFAVFAVANAVAPGEFGEVFSFPNPARGGRATVHVETASADSVRLRFYTLAGLLVHQAELTGAPVIGVNGKLAYEYVWNTSGIAAGGYLYVVEADRAGETARTLKKLAVVR